MCPLTLYVHLYFNERKVPRTCSVTLKTLNLASASANVGNLMGGEILL